MKATIFKLGGLFVAMVLLSGASSYAPNMRAAVGLVALLTVVLIAYAGGFMFCLVWRRHVLALAENPSHLEREIRRLRFRGDAFAYLSLVLGLLCLAQALYAMVRP